MRARYLRKKYIQIKLPDKDYEVELPGKQAERIGTIALFAKVEVDAEYGFRLLKNLQRLAMANAIKSARTVVNDDDVEVVRLLSNYMNLDMNEMV